MDIYENILKQMGVDIDAISPTFKGYFIGEKILYLQGVLRIISFSDKKITLQIKSKRIDVSGSDLTIKKYCSGDMVICGQISAIEIL